jgi:pilus assembly protein CpaF
MENEVIVTHDLFTYEFNHEDENGKLIGEFRPGNVRPYFASKAAYYGLEQELIKALA